MCCHVIPSIEESGTEDHHRLAGALLQLQLNRRELATDDAHHAVNLLRHHWPCSALLSQQVHHVGRELGTRLKHTYFTRAAITYSATGYDSAVCCSKMSRNAFLSEALYEADKVLQKFS